MSDMNKIMDPQKTAATLKEFEKQNMKMEMTEEMSKLYSCRGFRTKLFIFSVAFTNTT